MNEEINNILKIFEDNHIYFYINKSKNDIKQYICEYIEKKKINNNYDLLFLLKCILAFSLGKYDSHTRIRFADAKDLPMKLKIIDEKLFVIDTAEEYKRFKYMELVKVNGINVKEFFPIIKESVCYSTKGHLEQEIEKYFSTNQLKILPIIDDKKQVKFELKSREKTEYIVINLNKDYKVDFHNKMLVDNFKCKIQNENLIIKYNDCNLPKENKYAMDELVKNVSNILNKNRIKSIVLDFRGNTGGSATIFLPMLNFLNENKEKYKIYCFIDKYNFSAIRFNILDCKRILGATLIGTEIGTRLNCFGQCEHFEYNLDNIEKLDITVSKKYFFINNDGQFRSCSTKELVKSLYETERDKFDEDKFIHPDIFIKENIENYKNFVDNYFIF